MNTELLDWLSRTKKVIADVRNAEETGSEAEIRLTAQYRALEEVEKKIEEFDSRMCECGRTYAEHFMQNNCHAFMEAVDIKSLY